MKPNRTISDCNSWSLFHITEQEEKFLQDFIGTASAVLKDDLALHPLARCLPYCENTKLIFNMKQARNTE